VLTQGGPGRATEMLNYYTFVNAFQYLDIGYASTLAIALFVLVAALSVVFMQLRMRALDMVE
jgi:ABC-type sugar transport system permease subunit